MKNEIKNRFLSCGEDGLESFLSCGRKLQTKLLSSQKSNLFATSASKLSCLSSNVSEAESPSVKQYRAKTLILGIDPGIKGAIAFVKSGTNPVFVAVYDLPTYELPNGKKRLNLEELSFLISTYAQDVNLAIVEEVGQVGTEADPFSSFVFGFATGAAHGVLASNSIRIETVRPNVWKAALGLDSDKNKSLEKARRFFPEATNQLKRKMDDGRAEALLLAYFANQLLRRNG